MKRFCPTCVTGTALAAAALAGCSASDPQDIQTWMSQQAAQVRPPVEAMAQPLPFAPQPYTEQAATDPFDNRRLAQALRRDAGQPSAASSLLSAERSRRKQPLEAVPLEAMALVGSLVRQGQPVALVRVNGNLHAVRPGAYLGQNYGKVTRVTETEVVLREIVQDVSGEWIERAASLRLQERNP